MVSVREVDVDVDAKMTISAAWFDRQEPTTVAGKHRTLFRRHESRVSEAFDVVPQQNANHEIALRVGVGHAYAHRVLVHDSYYSGYDLTCISLVHAALVTLTPRV